MAASMIVSCPTVAQARTCVPSSKAVQPRAGGSLVTQRSISPSRWHPGLDDPVLQYIRSERRTRMELPRACMRTLPMFEASTGLRVAKRLVARRRSVCVRSTNKVRKSLGGGFVEVMCGFGVAEGVRYWIHGGAGKADEAGGGPLAAERTQRPCPLRVQPRVHGDDYQSSRSKMSFPRRQGFQQLSKEVMGVPRFPTNRSNQSQPQAPTVRALGTCSLRWKMSRVTSSSVQSQRNPFIKKATGAVHNASNPVSGWKSGLMPLSICDCLTGLEPSSPFAGRWVEASGRAASQGGQRGTHFT
eukprot:558858-Prorocentrum_minimum.AAC.3